MFWSSTLMLLVPLAAGHGATPEDAAKKELQLFQGIWKAIAVQNADGNRAPEDDVRNTRLVVEGNKFTLTSKNATIAGTFTINPTKTPKTIDVRLESNEGKETKLLGIYQIKGGTRKSCFAFPGKDRPTRFSTEKEYIGFEWQRK